MLSVTSGKSLASSWCHAEKPWRESMPSEHKRCNPINIHRQQSLENGRKMIGVQE
jgi:hypothetical protein